MSRSKDAGPFDEVDTEVSPFPDVDVTPTPGTGQSIEEISVALPTEDELLMEGQEGIAPDILDEEVLALRGEEGASKARNGINNGTSNGVVRDQQVNVALSREELAKIDRVVAYLGGSRADLVRQCVLNSTLVRYIEERIEKINSAAA